MKYISFVILFFINTSIFSQEITPQVGSEYQGGIIVYKTSNDHGLIIAKEDAPNEMIWEVAKYYCENLEIDGYKGWRLPNNQEWLQIYKFWKKTNIRILNDFSGGWSATEAGKVYGKLAAYVQIFTDGSQSVSGNRECIKLTVRPVRSF